MSEASQPEIFGHADCLVGPGNACRFEDLGRFKDRSGVVDDVRVVKCQTCGLGVTKPNLPDVAFLYADRTSQDFQPDGGVIARTLKRLVFRRGARHILRALDRAPDLIVDFACGSGLFTQCLAEEAAPSRVVGADFHETPPQELQTAEYLPIGKLPELAGQADLVLAMHVLEHDDDPRALLARIVQLVRPGGRLIVETPNVDCVWMSVFGKSWDAWYPPYHRRHFNRRNLRALIETVGLSVVAEEDVSAPTMGRTLANLLGLRNNAIFILIGAALHPVQWALERLTRKPVAIRIIACNPRS
ncbi:MAG TPA: class I SAM-dependent methyltransferase [Caulobacteraceae bacterium]|nr:class I SAM-dependent methyltransferase [Caulobacteraceae bacterium]